jgi:carboxyl-terminal processing protease
MKNTSFLFLLLLTGFLGQISVCAQTTTNKKNKESQILALVLKTLNDKHINPVKLDDTFSKKMFKSYIDSLDVAKLFLLESDIEEFKKYETKLDDQIKENDLSFFDFTYERLIIRMNEGKVIYSNLLKNNFDFSTNEVARYTTIYGKFYDKQGFAKNKSELNINWHNFLKSHLIELVKKDIIKDYSNVNTFDLLLSDKINGLEKYLEGTIFNPTNRTRSIVFQNYINAIAQQNDLYTNYYTPEILSRYLTRKTAKIEGCGIVVRSADDFVEVKDLSEGSPAMKTNMIEIGDKILKVTNENDTPVSTIGLTHYEVSKLFRGKAGTNIKILIKKPNGSIKEVSFKRGIVSKNDNYIKSCIVKKNNLKFGLINLSHFYNELEDLDAITVTKDFYEELKILQQEKIEGLILDLRFNQGGPLESVVKILGNFMSYSPVGQVRTKSNTKPTALLTDVNTDVFNKSIVVIVNEDTCAGAEFLASALKENKAAIIIGAKTLGYGTIQNLISLDENNSVPILGAINISEQSIFNINGIAIQKTGVQPDVNFLESIKKQEIVSNNQDLDIENIKSIKFEIQKPLNYYDKAIINSKQRIKNSNKIKIIKNNYQQEYLFEKGIISLRSLNVNLVKTEIQKLVLKSQATETPQFDKNIDCFFPDEILKRLKNKPYLMPKRRIWLGNLKNDFEIEEGINILEDMNNMK